MSSDVSHTRMLSEEVAEEIRVALVRRRMSGRQLARRLEVSPNWVSLRLTGVQAIDLNDLQRIAIVLDVDIADLLPRKGREASTRLPQPGRPAAGRPPNRAPDGSPGVGRTARTRPPSSLSSAA